MMKGEFFNLVDLRSGFWERQRITTLIHGKYSGVLLISKRKNEVLASNETAGRTGVERKAPTVVPRNCPYSLPGDDWTSKDSINSPRKRSRIEEAIGRQSYLSIRNN